MSARIGAAGRQARQLGIGRQVRQRMPATGDEPLPLQRAANGAQEEQRPERQESNPPAGRTTAA